MPAVFKSAEYPALILSSDDARCLRWLRRHGAVSPADKYLQRHPKMVTVATAQYLLRHKLIERKRLSVKVRRKWTIRSSYRLTECGLAVLGTIKRTTTARQYDTAYVDNTPSGPALRRFLRLRREAIIARRTHKYDGKPLDADDLARLYTKRRKRNISSWVVNFLYQEGFPLKQIAWGITPWVPLATAVDVSNTVRRLNLPRRRNIVSKRSDTKWSDFAEEWAALRFEGSSYHDIARAYGTRAETVRKYAETSIN